MCGAGLAEYNLYTLRHTFATLAIQGGMSLRDLQKHMDHSSSSITEHYLHDFPRDDIAPKLGL
jgi:integrase